MTTRPPPSSSVEERLALVCNMLSEAVTLLNETMEEVKTGASDDGHAARPPQRKPQQPR